MEACVVNCGGPSDHSTTPFSFPTATSRSISVVTQASPTTRRSLTFCRPRCLTHNFNWFVLLQHPSWVLHWRVCALSPRKWGPVISSKHVTILIESCKSADNLGNYCRNAFAVNFNFCLTDLISWKCKNSKGLDSVLGKTFSQNKRGKAYRLPVSLRTKQSTSCVLSCSALCPVYNDLFFIF